MYLLIHTDGGSRGNPGPAAAGVVITDKQGKTLFARGYFLGKTTNNVAEYEGVLRSLSEAANLGGTQLEICCDSELVVRQINGEFRVKNAKLRPLHRQIMRQLAEFDKTTVQHVYRQDNVEADALVNAALDAETDVNDISSPGNPPPGNPVVGQVIELDAKIQFLEDQPFHETLNESGSLPTKFICLKSGQSCTIQLTGTEVTILCMQGCGAITVNDEIHRVKTHSWLSLRQVSAFTMQSDSKDNLVILLTRRR